MKITKGMWLERVYKDPCGILKQGVKYCVSQINHNGTSIRIVGDMMQWYSTASFNIPKQTSKKEGSMWNTNAHHHDDDICEGCNDCCGEDYDEACDECKQHRDDNCGIPLAPPVSKPMPYGTTTPTGGNTMGLNTTIASMYDSTKDAVLVNKYFGHEIQQNKSSEVLFADKADELLAKAKELQAKEDAQRNVVRAQIVE